MTTHENHDHFDPVQAEVFERLYKRVGELLRQFGRPNFLRGQPRGDYSVHGDYSEYPQVVVFVSNLALLRPQVVCALQDILRDFSGWQIDLMVAIWDYYKDWPDMGLSIHQNEVLDALQRQYFPEEFRGLTYENARASSVADFVKR